MTGSPLGPWRSQRPRIRLMPVEVASSALVGVLPTARMTSGAASTMWRSTKGRNWRASASEGVRLPGGRQGRMLVM